MFYDQPVQPQPDDMSDQKWSQLTPQQKLAFTMMLNNQQKPDQRGAYSPAQGMSNVMSSALQGYMMGGGKFGAQGQPGMQGQGMPWAGANGSGMMGTMG